MRCSPWVRSRPAGGIVPSWRRRRSGLPRRCRTTNTSAALSSCAGPPTTSASEVIARRRCEFSGSPTRSLPTRPHTTLQGLTFAVRAQVESLVGGDVGRQRRVVSELTHIAEHTGDETSNAAARMLAVGMSFVVGTLDDVRARRDDLMEMAERFPRQDLRWWPLAIDGSIAIAVGDFEAAERAIVAAETDGASRRTGDRAEDRDAPTVAGDVSHRTSRRTCAVSSSHESGARRGAGVARAVREGVR